MAYFTQRRQGAKTQRDWLVFLSFLASLCLCVKKITLPFLAVKCPVVFVHYFGRMVTITLLYRVSRGVPLSVTFKMKCVVWGLSTSGAFNSGMTDMFSAGPTTIVLCNVPASRY